MSEFEFEAELEVELRQRMKRVAAPAGFADAIFARTRSGIRPGTSHAGRAQNMRPSSWPSFLLLAASLVVACGSALEARHQQEVRQMRQAQQIAGQFNLAIAVTARTLHHIDENVSRAGTTAERQP